MFEISDEECACSQHVWMRQIKIFLLFTQCVIR